MFIKDYKIEVMIRFKKRSKFYKNMT